MDCGESISKHHQTMAYPRFLLQNFVHLIFLFLKGFNRVPKENWKQESVRRIINSGHTCALTFLFDTRSIILSRLKILWQFFFDTILFSLWSWSLGKFLTSTRVLFSLGSLSLAQVGQIPAVTQIFRPEHNCGIVQWLGNVEIHSCFKSIIFGFYRLKTNIWIQIIITILVGTIFVRIFQFQVDGALKPKHQLNLSLQNIELDIYQCWLIKLQWLEFELKFKEN